MLKYHVRLLADEPYSATSSQSGSGSSDEQLNNIIEREEKRERGKDREREREERRIERE